MNLIQVIKEPYREYQPPNEYKYLITVMTAPEDLENKINEISAMHNSLGSEEIVIQYNTNSYGDIQQYLIPLNIYCKEQTDITLLKLYLR